VQREIPVYTLEGVKDAEVSTHYIYTEDKLCLSALRFQRGEAGEAILVIHGLTTSSDMFIMPEHYNLVSYLLDHGYPGPAAGLAYTRSGKGYQILTKAGAIYTFGDAVYYGNLLDHAYPGPAVALSDTP